MHPEDLLPAMRARLNAFLPEKAFLRRDRGDWLLISNAPVFDPALKEIPGFLLEIQGSLMRILPDESWIAALEEMESEDHFCASLARFRGQKSDLQNRMLFALGAKLMDDPAAATRADLENYDRSLRQRAAVALRGGCGGALYACALIHAKITHYYKGENAP